MFVIIVMMIAATTVTSKPVADMIEIDTTVGSKMALECTLDNLEENVVVWKHEDRVLFAGDIRVRHDERIEVIEDSLVINDVEPEDKGQYTCEIENNKGVFNTISQIVNILEPTVAKINQVGSHLTVKAGTSLALTCSGSGVPLPEVRWRKGLKVLSRGIGEAGVLLEYLTRADIGDIVCEAFNGVGNTAEDTLTLDVLYAPEVEMLQPQISFQPKCGMEFQCLVHSSSSPTIHWFQNDLLLQPKNGVTIWSLDNLHVLQIHSCDQNILGQFTCKAKSSMGEGQDSVRISRHFIEKRMEKLLLAEDISNNVRRNVENQEAQPLVNSACGYLVNLILLVNVLIVFM